MKQKSKFRRFWNLDHRKSDGFTLVELIVVIAILAILAGVGSAGYAGYIEASNKNADIKLVGDVMRALETSAYSYSANFDVEGQYSAGMQIPVGYVVLSTEGTEAVSNDAENDPLGKALTAAFGANYENSMKLKYSKWEAGAVGGSTLHNAAAGMLNKIDKTGALMVALQDTIQLTNKKYDSSGDMIVEVSGNVADYNGDGIIDASDKTAFVQAWNAASSDTPSSSGFGLAGRENYSAVRMAYNNSFAEYVRANYSGTKDADALADGIANYGQSAGDLAYDKTIEKVGDNWAGKLAASAAQGIVDRVAPDTNFPYTASAKAFDDPKYIGYGDEDIKNLYNEWIAGPAADDAAMFYDIMVTSATDGKKYVDENGADDFVDWFAGQAKDYSDNINAVQAKVAGKSAIAVAAYYQDGKMEFDVYSAEADPRAED